MATSGIGWAAPDPEQDQINRARAYAQALRKQAADPLNGQIISGHYVAPSWTQQLSKALDPYFARKAEESADQRQKVYEEEQNRKAVEDIGALTQALQGSPARTIQPLTPNDDEGNAMPAVDVAAQGPDRQKALAIALGSKNPMVQQIGGSLVAGMLPKAPEWQVTERYNAQGQPEKVIIDKNNPTNVLPFGGAQATKGVAVNGQLVNPTTGETIGQAIPKQPDAPNVAKDLLIPDGKGGYTVNTALVGVKKDIAKSGATNVSLNTEKSYAGNVAEGLAKQDLAALDAAGTARERIANAQRVKTILDTQAPITGTGAEARLSFNKALATAGLVDGRSVKSTEDLASILANSTLDAIKTSGLGGGNGFTDKDRAFLERAKSGNIEINAGTLRELADLNERAARASLDRGAAVAKRLKGNPSFGSVGQDLDFTQPPAYNGNSPKKPTAAAPPDIQQLINQYGGSR